jgi:endonuclease/exonuclease/phosphatase family metal-dependent hydrolase
MKSMFAPLAALLLVFPLASFAQEQPQVRVMSFNIRYGTAADGDNHWNLRKEWLVETIAKFQPDLLGTQETLGFQRDFIASQLPELEAFGVGRDDGGEKGEMTALFFRRERFEKVDGGHFWLSETPEKVGSRGWDAALPRMVSWVKLRDRMRRDQPDLLFANTHFDHMGNRARENSATLIRQKLKEIGGNCMIVLTGDFNAGEGSVPYKNLLAEQSENLNLRDTFRVAHPQKGSDEGTFSGFKAQNTGGARIDWIAVSNNLEIKEANIDRTAKDGRTPSDHYPVTAILELK